MDHRRAAKHRKTKTSEPAPIADDGASFQCALLLFVSAMSSFIGASLLLAGI